jgi:transcription-repair coupling factor (superfamily II helicase)
LSAGIGGALGGTVSGFVAGCPDAEPSRDRQHRLPGPARLAATAGSPTRFDIGVAHGQMEGSHLEDVLMKFINREYDVLLCTNIIESGIDIANANTMIINNAHQFGLSDLHQLRGRVGRSNKHAFCYLLSPPLSTLSSESRQRLKTIEEFSDLGSGFNIAMRDMDIRGAGNMLGCEQSGFIAEIGLEVYQKILDEAVRELKQTDFKDLYKDELERTLDYVRDCAIETDLEMLIPNEFVSNTTERMLLYREPGSVRFSCRPPPT